jgi:3-hydroxymyristoyl/3-hydroxydecanoyl-(acyl carrier protein) dehydratase
MEERIFPEYPGHFPGEPLVPGAALLGWLQEVLTGQGLRLTMLDRVRFLQPVRPGEKLKLTWNIDGDRLSFQVEGSGVVARGLGRVG